MVIQWDWMGLIRIYDGPLVMTVTVCYWKWPSIVDLPIKHGGFPVRKALVYQRVVMTLPLAIYCYRKASCILTNNLSHVFQGERLRWVSNNDFFGDSQVTMGWKTPWVGHPWLGLGVPWLELEEITRHNTWFSRYCHFLGIPIFRHTMLPYVYGSKLGTPIIGWY